MSQFYKMYSDYEIMHQLDVQNDEPGITPQAGAKSPLVAVFGKETIIKRSDC